MANSLSPEEHAQIESNALKQLDATIAQKELELVALRAAREALAKTS